MPETLDPAVLAAKNLLRSVTPWVWLLLIRANADDAFRFAVHDQPVEWNGYTYAPFPCILAAQQQTSHGVLSDFSLEVSNLSKEVTRRLEADEVIDEILTASLVNLDNLDSTTKVAYSTRYRILSADVNLTSVRFGLGQWNLYNSPFPAQSFRRNKCKYIYGDKQCGYDTGRSGALATCDLTKDGANGCTAHGLDELAAGLPQFHPERHGAETAIPTGSSRT